MPRPVRKAKVRSKLLLVAYTGFTLPHHVHVHDECSGERDLDRVTAAVAFLIAAA